eukprot:3652470-Pyramimonas_sp.AAC.1
MTQPHPYYRQLKMFQNITYWRQLPNVSWEAKRYNFHAGLLGVRQKVLNARPVWAHSFTWGSYVPVTRGTKPY